MRLKFLISLTVLGTLLSSMAVAQQTAKITSSNIAYLEYLPQGYSGNSNLYPLVISLHGIKEKGTTSTDPAALKSSVQTVANVGLPKYIKYGAQYKFIVISPQLKSSYGSWPASYVMDVINYAKKTLRVDPKRIYITGLSLGGFGAWTTLGASPTFSLLPCLSARVATHCLRLARLQGRTSLSGDFTVMLTTSFLIL